MFVYLLKLARIKGALRNKILAMMLLVGVVPLVALSFLAFYSLNVFHGLDVADIESNLIRQKTEEVERFINDIVGSLDFHVEYEEYEAIRLYGQVSLLQPAFQRFPEIEELYLINVAPGDVQKDIRDDSGKLITSVVEEAVYGKESLRYSRSRDGSVPMDELRDQSQTEKFITASATSSAQNYIGPVVYTSKGPMMTLAAPVYSRNNAVLAVVAAEVNLNKLQSIIGKSRLGNTGYVYLTDRDGFLLAHSRLEKIEPIGLRHSGFIDDLLSGRSRLGIEAQNRYQSFWGEEVVAAGDFMPEFSWAIVAEWPAKDADRIVSAVRNQILAVSLAVLIATIILSLFLASRIVKPIKELEAGTKLVAEGKFDQPVRIMTNDELEELGLAFNQMMEGLKQLEELKKEFVFIAAHELRTPVTAIKGYLSMVMDGDAGPVSSSIKELLEKVIKSNQRLINLVNDLLEVARSEAGRLTIKVAAVDITEPIKAVLSELQPLADEKSIKMVYEPPANLPHALADSDRVKEVMVNLIGNAIKYTIGSGTVTISHEVRGRELITHIKDTGIGMPKEAQKKLFEKFYRVQDEKTRGITGTGLGLFIVKQIIEKMNGKIWVESEEGKGSVFSFSLPLT